MISYICNSKKKYYILSLLTLLLSGMLLSLTKNMPSAFRVIPNLAELVKSKEYYLQYNDVSIDDYVLFHGFKNTLPYIKKAETILLGSSRLGYAIQNSEIKGKEHEPYVLAFGHEEMDIFPIKIISKFNLSPKLFVINIDQFFENKMSKFSSKISKEGYFPAIRSIFEYNISTLAQNELHKFLPYFAPFFTHREEVVLVRSRLNGTWNFLKEPVKEQYVRIPESVSPTQQQISYGKSVLQKLKNQGSDVVFILIPNPDTPIKWAEEFSKELGVDFWRYEFEGIKFRDGSHMTQEEGVKYTKYLMDKIQAYY